jgi:IS5 family transposase
VDRAKQGIKHSVAVDAEGIPLGVITAPANRHDSPLLSETLDTVGELPEQASSHLDRAYDSDLTRELLESHDLIGVISLRKASLLRSKLGCGGSSRGPIPGITPTRSSYGVPSAKGRVIDFWVAFSNVVILVRRLIRKAGSLYRWESRPSRRPRPIGGSS